MSSFRDRAGSGLVYVLLSIAVAWLGGWPLAVYVSLVSVIGLKELADLGDRIGLRVSRPILLPLGALVPLLYRLLPDDASPLAGLVILSAFALGALLLRAAHTFRGVGFGLFGLAYVPALAGHLVLLRQRSPEAVDGFLVLLLVLVATWACDTGAYAVGTAVGRHALWPRVSPKKSVEGAAGGVVLAVAASLAWRAAFAPQLGAERVVLLGLTVGVLAQLGDLFESWLKRRAGVKDTSSLIPGHGGVLDRFDSLLLTAPATYYILWGV